MQRKALSAFILAAGLAAAPQVLAAEGKLVLYTSQPNTDAQQTIDAFKAKYPKVEVSFVRDGTPRVMAKLKACPAWTRAVRSRTSWSDSVGQCRRTYLAGLVRVKMPRAALSAVWA